MTMVTLDAAEKVLLNRWQRGFPLVPRPFAEIAGAMNCTEADVLGTLEGLARSGVLSRIGATLRPNTAGSSVLAAISVPPRRLDEVAAIVNLEPGVNHNYEREHAYNLWFVMTGRTRADVVAALARISAASGLDILELPLERGYHIDLGFPLETPLVSRTSTAHVPAAVEPATPDATDRALLEALEPGLHLVPRPYAALGRLTGHSEAGAISGIGALVSTGIISRFGLIVHHRTLGYAANAMTVWDVDDAVVDAVGARLAREGAVTLCYRRPRRRPHWPYNLFCMVHGRERGEVREQIAELTRRNGLETTPRAILFSVRCFRQRGATLRTARSQEQPACP